MRNTLVLITLAALFAAALPAAGELQNVIVGGQIRIRGNWWTSPTGPDTFYGRNPLFQWPWTNSSRPAINPFFGVRWPAVPGRLAVVSPVDWDEHGSGVRFVEQRTRLNVRADFTDQVSAFVELDSYDIWGEDFRSNYITGVDARSSIGGFSPVGVDGDVEVFQAYVQAQEMFGVPLRLRVGRQEMKFGSGWLVGTNEAGSFFRGLSFDAIRATYATDLFSVDAFWAKLAETSPIEEDGDVDFYGVYGSYLGIEGITLDAYWFLVRDARALKDTNGAFLAEWIENAFNVDDYDRTYLHTVGLRAAGAVAGFDFEAEAAYQFGDASAVGRTFAGTGLASPYGDDDAEFGEWAGNLRLGYSFDVAWKPHVFIGGSYYGGEDNRDLNFWQWLGAVACPFWSADASVSFNRLFSDWQYGNFVSSPDHDCSNLWVVYGGLTLMPTDSLVLVGSVAYVESLADYEAPWPVFHVFGTRIVPLANWSFLSRTNDDDLCVEAGVSATYKYSEDLSFEAGYSHLFLGDGAAQGNFNILYGLGFEGGTSDEDSDYLYFETKLSF